MTFNIEIKGIGVKHLKHGVTEIHSFRYNIYSRAKSNHNRTHLLIKYCRLQTDTSSG
uniref:Uncharacterized protein n=1 Tax=Anguilla anguilla TaxID=7936 RepID=A0A0E9VGE0_ANGAN